MLNGVTDLMMMKSDVLSGFEELQLCTSYRYQSQDIKELPMELSNVSANYTRLPGWNEDLTHFKKAEQLPTALKQYIQFIEAATSTPISLVSVGPGREQTLFL
jgi:adenylosuccinate synthase